ncbi:hypothetical protein Tco_1540335 [Tanacetum coccineum]
MHNNIMAAGSKDRPPMLGPGRYSQWRSRFLRYLDTKSNGEYLRKCIFEGPYTPTSVLIAAVEAAENIPPVAAHEEAETIHNMTTENKLYFQAEKEAIFLDFDCLLLEMENPWSLITPEQARRDKDMQKNLALLAKYFKKLYKPTNNNLRTSSNSRNKTEDTTPSKAVRSATKWDHALNCKGFGHYPGMQEAKADTDEEIDEQELEAHYSYMAKIQEVSTKNPVSTRKTKTILKQLKKANASLTQELKECKTNLDETSRALGEATSSRDSCLIALQTKQTELEKYTALNDRTSDYKILQTKLNETLGLLALKDI